VGSPSQRMLLRLSTKTANSKGRVSAVALPRTTDVIGDTGTVADCVRTNVGFCIRSPVEPGDAKVIEGTQPIQSDHRAARARAC
jgi:hypothetical protein